MIKLAWMTIWPWIKPFAKPLAWVAIGVAALFTFNWWLNNERDNAADAREREIRAEMSAMIEQSNREVEAANLAMTNMADAFDRISVIRDQQLRIEIDPIIKDIENEIAQDARYRECVLSGGVLDGINSGITRVNANLGASTSRTTGKASSTD